MNTKEKYKLPEPFRSNWILALKSGVYKQGNNSLYNIRDNTFCCLGVAECIMGVQKEVLASKIFPKYLSDYNQLPSILDGDLDDLGWKLAVMNDNNDSFESIAAYIEENTIPE